MSKQTGQPPEPTNDGKTADPELSDAKPDLPVPLDLFGGYNRIRFLCALGLLLALVYLIDQFSLRLAPPSVFLSGLAFGLALSTFLIWKIINRRILLREARLEDPSKVSSMFTEVDTVEPRLTEPKKPDEFETKVDQVQREVTRLKELGEGRWTEYEVLSLNQLLVEFLKTDELTARAQSSLEDLQEYADERYDQEHYEQWKKRVDGAIEKIDSQNSDAAKRDEAAEALRGQLRTLLEHVASYDRYWAEGRAIIRSLMACGVVSIPILVAMGLLPLFHPAGSRNLSVFDWGLLGASGAIIAVLLGLYRSKLVEVGNTAGRAEVWRAVIAVPLGFVAGILLYSMIAGNILAGSAFPQIGASERQLGENVGRSIFWGMASGFSFEWVFDRLRTTTVEESR